MPASLIAEPAKKQQYHRKWALREGQRETEETISHLLGDNFSKKHETERQGAYNERKIDRKEGSGDGHTRLADD